MNENENVSIWLKKTFLTLSYDTFFLEHPKTLFVPCSSLNSELIIAGNIEKPCK